MAEERKKKEIEEEKMREAKRQAEMEKQIEEKRKQDELKEKEKQAEKEKVLKEEKERRAFIAERLTELRLEAKNALGIMEKNPKELKECKEKKGKQPKCGKEKKECKGKKLKCPKKEASPLDENDSDFSMVLSKVINENLELAKEEILKKTLNEANKVFDKIKQSHISSSMMTSIVIHSAVCCDGCGVSPIVGNRYKCTVCSNFDYCENCEEKNSEIHQHPFFKNKKTRSCTCKYYLHN